MNIAFIALALSSKSSCLKFNQQKSNNDKGVTTALSRGFAFFAVGRPDWDNWFIFRYRQLKLPVIDMSDVVTIVHQKHDYSHVKKKIAGTKWDGPEGDKNMAFIGERIKLFNISHANYLLTKKGLKKGRRKRRPIGKWRDEKLALYPSMKWPVLFVYTILSQFRNLYTKMKN